jgi:RNA polymerase sigma-70 factor (ECF subfamily)
VVRGDDVCAGTTAGEEAELVRHCRDGDQRAFAALMSRHRRLVYAACWRVTRNDEDTEDAVQETMRAVWRGIGRFDGRSAFSTWLYRIAHNEAVDVAARTQRAPLPMAEPPDVRDPQAVEHQVVSRLVLGEALDGVPHAFRAAVALRDVHGLTYEEIGRELHIKIDTVKSRISRGRRALRELLAEPGGA